MYTESTCLDAHLASVRNPMFGLKVIIKSDVTQCDFCLGITNTPTFIKIWLETNCALARVDTVYMVHIADSASYMEGLKWLLVRGQTFQTLQHEHVTMTVTPLFTSEQCLLPSNFVTNSIKRSTTENNETIPVFPKCESGMKNALGYPSNIAVVGVTLHST